MKPAGAKSVMSERTRLLNDERLQRGSGDKDEKRKRFQTIVALAASMLTQSFLLVGVFPYSGFMAMHLIPKLNEENAGSYAGFIASSFMVGRTFSSFGWGRVSDRYGRVFVIKLSLLLSAVFSILFGLAPTFYTALIWRCTLGLSNGMMGPIKTLISEMNQGDNNKETQMMALVLGMWGYGFLINPAITGYLADPVKQYPNSNAVKIFDPLLRAYPFLLPNMVGCIFCLIAYILVHKFVEETLPLEKRCTFFSYKSNIIRTVSSWGLFKHLYEGEGPDETIMPLSCSTEKQGGRKEKQDDEPATIYSLWKRKGTRQHLLVTWNYSFLITTIDESFPLYCLSKASGLAIEEKIIGTIFSGSGFFYVIFQYFLLTGLVRRFGFYKTLRIGTLFSVPLCSLIPLSLLTNKDAREGTLNWSTFVLLSIVYAIVRVFSSLVFATLTMTTNRTVPTHQRGTMQGLCLLGSSFSKAFGPVFAGILFSTSVGYFTPPTGSVVVYATISGLGLCLVMQALILQEPDQDETSALSMEVREEKFVQYDHDHENQGEEEEGGDRSLTF